MVVVELIDERDRRGSGDEVCEGDVTDEKEESVANAMNAESEELGEVITERKVVAAAASGTAASVTVVTGRETIGELKLGSGVNADGGGNSGTWDEGSGTARMAASVVSAGDEVTTGVCAGFSLETGGKLAEEAG